MKMESAISKKTFDAVNPGRLLQVAGSAWFVTAVIGQWIFVCYVASYFGPILFEHGLEGLKETHLPNGFVTGDMVGNLAIAAHILLAIIIIGGGPLQFMPAVRNRFPAFHRANGRVYMALVFVTSLAGLFLVWTRGVLGGFAGHIAISLDAILIMAFAVLTLRYALTRQFQKHHRWALRLFMVVNAVWFFRIGFMLWMVLTGGIGIDMATFTGPAIVGLYFGQMLVPLAFLELYFWAQSSSNRYSQRAVAVTVFVLTGLTAAGTFAATVGMWFPRVL